MNSAAVPRLRTLLRQPARRERADARRDDDRPRGETILVRDEHEMPVLFLEADHVLAEVDRLAELRLLFGELLHEILGEDLRKTGDVEDVFLGVQRRELSAELRQRVDDLRRRLAHAGIEQSEDP